jgi:hypothetical protein
LIPQQLLGFEEAAKDALAADRAHSAKARWVEGSIACRDFRPEYSFYAKHQGASTTTSATCEEVWETVVQVGQDSDFFFAPWLWWMRRTLDWLVGGPSFRRKRRHPRELRLGDVLDSWRVIAVEPCNRLLLLMEMRAPGFGVLEYTIDDDGERRRVAVTAHWHPAGVWGLLYWGLLLPFHGYLFRGTVRSIARRAEQAQAQH